MSENPNPITPISDLNTRIQAIVQKETIGKPLWVHGTVHNKNKSDRGHIYFRLVDDIWSISCMMYESNQGELGFTLQDGMEVEVFGDIRIYERSASLQISVQKIKLLERSSIPDFMDAEEYLRAKGLWGRPKKPLPLIIERIAVITSVSSKALTDFKDTYNSKSEPTKAAQILVEDVPLEGEFAAAKIAAKIRYINGGNLADVIVLTRGGGRASQLATFNDPLIAEAIIESTIPVITAIGHASDQTFADIVADMVAITATDAAVKLVQRPDLLPNSQQNIKSTKPKSTIPCAKLFGMISMITALTLLFIQVLLG